MGSYIEKDLADWYDGTFYMKFSSDAISGKRIFAKTRFMLTDDGKFVILADDPGCREADAFATAMSNGGVDVEYFTPSRNRAMLGLLKSMYLAVCLDMDGPPAGLVANEVRRELVAAREAPNREAVPTSELALGLKVSRGYDEQRATDAPVSIAVSGSKDSPRWGVLLTGSVFVEFPSGFPVAGINEAA